MNFPIRKSTRLENYDYSQSGAYFITVCSDKHRCMFSRISVGALHEAPEFQLTEYGKIVKEVLDTVAVRFENVSISDYVIMPNHLHLILYLNSCGRALREAPLPYKPRSELSKVIGFLKMNATKRIHEISPHEVVWQRGYYDHIIRDESDYAVRAKYICDNPFKWRDDEYFSVGDTNEIYHHG